MVLCQNCFEKHAVFNIEGYQAQYCFSCKLENMINVTGKRCKESGCSKQPFFNYRGENKGMFCSEHKLNNMIDVKHKTCEHIGCRKRSNFNYEGENKARFCSEHKLNDMIDVKNKRCEYISCKKQPYFNYEGENKGRFCSEHKLDNMVNVKDKKCEYIGCKKRPNFNYEKEIKGRFCFEHKLDNMVDVKSKKCEHIGCKKHPYFNYEGENKGRFCSEHKLDNMVNVISKKCEHIGCKKRSYFNYEGENKGRFCSEHRLDNMVDVKNKRCVESNCKKRANYGLLFEEKKHCSFHKGNNEYKNNKPKCIDCNENAYYTNLSNNYPLYCEKHQKEGSKNIVERPCKNCNLTYFIKEGLDLCNDCHNFTINQIHKHKETRIKNILDRYKIPYESHDKTVENGCSKYRPDFIIDCGLFKIILEVDENQHKSYPCECEQIRMIQIFQDFEGIHLIFVRFNPDEYINNQEILIKDTKGREKLLLSLIMSLRRKENLNHPLSVIYLYYDNYDNNSKKIKIQKIDYEDYGI